MTYALVSAAGQPLVSLTAEVVLAWLRRLGVPADAPPPPRSLYFPSGAPTGTIVFGGCGQPPPVLFRYAEWSGRRLVKAEEWIHKLDNYRNELALIVGPVVSPTWGKLVRLGAELSLAKPVLAFIPYQTVDELTALLVKGAIAAEVHRYLDSPFSILAEGSGPSNFSVGWSVERSAVLHSRPYCGVLGFSRRTTAICTSADGARGLCYAGNACALANPLIVPAEAISAPLVFLNGCSTALPPVGNVPFEPDRLIGYRIYKHSAGATLGNLGLGPAALWEASYRRVLQEEGENLVDQISALNAARARLDPSTAFRLVTFGDPALYHRPPSPSPNCTLEVREGWTAVRWAKGGGLPRARLDARDLTLLNTKTGLTAQVVRNGEPLAGATVAFMVTNDGRNGLLFFEDGGEGAATEGDLAVEISAETAASDGGLGAIALAAEGAAAAMAADTAFDLAREYGALSHSVHWDWGLATRTTVLLPPPEGRAEIARRREALVALVSGVILRQFVEAVESGTVDLSALYGKGVPYVANSDVLQTCPICAMPAQRRTRALVMPGTTCVTQLQCPICAIVAEVPEFLVVSSVEIAETGESMEVIVRFRNLCRHPIVFTHAWREEILRSAHETQRAVIEWGGSAVNLPAGEILSLRRRCGVRFVRMLQLLFCAGGIMGFVQIKDAEPARARSVATP